jgi:hypothetical protein
MQRETMKRRGRAPAPSDDAAVTAQTEISRFLLENGLNVAELSRRANCSAPAIWNALKRKPPVWSPTLTKLSEFLKAQNAERSLGEESVVERMAAAARGSRDSSAATAKLLRMVADLLDSGAAREGKPFNR